MDHINSDSTLILADKMTHIQDKKPLQGTTKSKGCFPRNILIYGAMYDIIDQNVFQP